MFCVGANEFGQCGTGEKSFSVFKAAPVQGLQEEVVTSVAAGFAHCVVATGE